MSPHFKRQTLIFLFSGPFKERIIGHVSDSASDIESASRGISVSVTKSKILQNFIQWSIDTYINAFPKKVGCHFQKAYDIYVWNPLRIPTLYIHSSKDIVSTPVVPLKSIKHQKKLNIPVFYHEFDTPHCQHFRLNHDKYSELVDAFIKFTKNNL